MSARLIMKLRVEDAVYTTPEVMRLRLRHPLRPQLPPWTAGAHVDLRLPDGRVRQYSLCGDPADLSCYEIAIKREEAGRGGSRWAHDNLSPGTIAHVSAPRNNFPLATDASHHVFIAGGIGVTPFLSMAHALKGGNATFDLHLCARGPDLAPLLPELRAIAGERLQCWFSSEGRRFDPRVLHRHADGVHFYACGPQRLTDAVQVSLEEAGCPADAIHVEHFGAVLDENFKPEPFDAIIASSGKRLHVPADRSLLDVLRDNGVNLSSSCEIGVCGSCECGYVDGTVIHRDAVLPVSRRQDRMMPCVSRARVGVTLAL